MNKQEREIIKEQKLIELINKTEAINDIAIKAEPFVYEYWSILKELWNKPTIGYNEIGVVKDRLKGVKGLSNEYRKLLK